MSATVYTKEQLIQYIAQCEERLKSTASAWMKSEIRKGIALAKAELEKILVAQLLSNQ